MADFRIGPAYLLIADDIEQPAANWTNLGPTRGDVVVNMTPSVLSRARLDTVGPAPVADGIWIAPAKMTVRAPLLDSTIERLNQLLPGSVVLTSGTKKALAIRRGTARITPFALAIVPVDEYNDESWWQAPHAIWFKQVYARVGEIPVATEVSDDDDALARVVYEVTFSRAIPNLVIYGPPYIAGSRAAGMLFYLDVESSLFKDELKAGTGQQGTFNQPTSRVYFDENGNYRTAAAGELIWLKAPSGRRLPVLWPAYTNQVTNNIDHNTASVWQVVFGNAVNWNGFNLREVIPTTYNGSHNTWRNYTGPLLANGAIICGAYVVRPLLGQSKWALGCFLSGGTTQRNLNVTLDLDGTEPTLPTETTQLKILKAGSIPLTNEYYYVYASFFVKDKEDHTIISVRNYILDSNNSSSFSGDGSTPYALIGADQLFFNIIYPPAPVLTTGSAIAIAQDQLTFPFNFPYPAEGLTFALEFERKVLANDLPPNIGLGNYYYDLGYPQHFDYDRYSPLGIHIGGDISIRPDKGGGIGFSALSNIKIAAHYKQTGVTWFNLNAGTSGSVATTASPGDPAIPPEIRFWVQKFGPIWIKRYVIYKGLIDPSLLL